MNDDDSQPTAEDRDAFDLRITVATEHGFCASDPSGLTAVFSTAAELCAWLEVKLRVFDTATVAVGGLDLPRVAQSAPAPVPRRRFNLLMGNQDDD